jgi:Kef-type K+ transport system membrane component KefB
MGYSMHTGGLLLILVQIAVILVVTRVVGYFLGKIGQPPVIGEIIGGTILGHVGLVLFMFVVGTEIDLSVVRKRARAVIVICQSSIVVPFLLGLAGGYWLYRELAPPGVSFLSWELFIGISVSITAFPVLARILRERGLSGSKAGILALTCAALDDVLSWCMLAVVVAIVKAQSACGSIYTIAFAIVFVSLMLIVVRPLLRKWLAAEGEQGEVKRGTMVILFLLLLVSSSLAELIGIHALFGAFLAGVVVPQNQNFRKSIVDKVEHVSVILLMPLFFAFSGLRTQIGLLSGDGMWVTCLLVTLGAIVGKFGSTALAARLVGENMKDSCTLGALMNTRGLIELVVLNIGYDLGVLPPNVFTMMVLMALITTFLTCPALDLINRVMYEVRPG